MVRNTFVSLSLVLVMTLSLSAQQWESLFNGQNLDHWTQPNGESIEAPAWEAIDGLLHLDRSKGEGGNIFSEQVYGDFELLFEWKVAEKSNNGIKYRVNDFDGRMLGLEYQVIDDPNRPQKPRHKTASIYDIYEPKEHSALLPTGEFNRGRILVRGNRIEHWLNGQLVTEATVGSAEWNKRIAESKFSDVPGFGVIPIGRIMITDHDDEVWYRNIFIRRIDVVDESMGTNAVATSFQCGAQPTCVPTTVCRSRPRLLRRWLRCR